MAYCKWTGNVVNQEYVGYQPYRQVRPVITSLLRCNFANRPSREEMLTRLTQLNGNCVVSQTMRFPQDIQVQVDGGVVGDCLSQLVECLSYVDHETNEAQNRKYDDTKLHFHRTVVRLNTILNTPMSPTAPTYGIFNRTSFENFFSLEWGDVRHDSGLDISRHSAGGADGSAHVSLPE